MTRKEIEERRKRENPQHSISYPYYQFLMALELAFENLRKSKIPFGIEDALALAGLYNIEMTARAEREYQ